MSSGTIHRYAEGLRIPPSINRCYGVGKYGNFYMRPPAKEWKSYAVGALKDLGWEKYEGECTWQLAYTLWCPLRRDHDSSLKIVIDVVEEVFEIDDMYCFSSSPCKRVEPKKANQRMDLIVVITPGAWNER